MPNRRARSVAGSEASASSGRTRMSGKRSAAANLSAPASAPPKRPRALPSGVQECQRCGETSEAKKWALLSQTQGPGGNIVQKPMGDACDECFSVWHNSFRYEYKTFEDMAAAYNNGQQKQREAIDRAFAVARGSKPDFAPAAVEQSSGIGLVLERRFITLTEGEMRASLGVPRLLKSHTKGLPTAVVPTEHNPSAKERVFFFADPAHPFRTARLSVASSCSATGLVADRAHSVYESQGRHAIAHTWKQHEVGSDAAALAAARVQPLGDFLAGHGRSLSGKGRGSARVGSADPAGREESEGTGMGDDDDDECSDDEDEEAAPNREELVGVAASLVGTTETLLSPLKRRPPVPAFGGSPSAKAPSDSASVAPRLGTNPPASGAGDGASVVSGRSSAGSGVGSGGNGGGDDGDDADDPDFDEFEGDLLAKWRQRLPLLSVMVGKPKGRTIKALRENIGRLGARPEMRDEANRLSAYLDSVNLAALLRSDKVASLPACELYAVLSQLESEHLSYPLEVQVSLVDHKAALLTEQGDLRELLVVMKPWVADDDKDGEFNVMQPKLRYLFDMPLASRILRFKQRVWAKALTPLIMSSTQADHSRLISACSVIKEIYGAEDPVSLDTPAATMVQELLVSSAAIDAVATCSVDPDVVDTLSHLRARRGKTDRSILTSTANAVYGNPWMRDLMDVYQRGSATVVEHGEKVIDYAEKLQGLKAAASDFDEYLEMLKLYGLLKSSSASELFQNFGDQLLKHILNSWKVLHKSVDAGEVSPSSSLLDSLEAFATEAAIVFSLEDKVLSMQSAIAEFRALQSGAAKSAELLACLADHTFDETLGDELLDNKLLQVKNAIRAQAGVPWPEVPYDTIEEFLKELACCTIRLLNKKNTVMADACTDIWGMLTRHHTPDIATKDILQLSIIITHITCMLLQAEKMPEPDLDTKAAHIQSMSVLVLRGEGVLKPLRDADRSDVLVALEAIAEKRIAEAKQVCSQFVTKLIRLRIEGVDKGMADVTTQCSGIDYLTWHNEVKGSKAAAWQKLLELATSSIQTIDTKALDASLAALATTMQLMTQAADLLGTAATPEIAAKLDAAKLVQKQGSSLLGQCLLFHTIMSDIEPDVMRRRVQQQVRVLRGQGLKEREILPEVLYKRTWGLLSCSL